MEGMELPFLLVLVLTISIIANIALVLARKRSFGGARSSKGEG